MATRIDVNRLLELADEVEQFDLGRCSPSDDPDKQTAYLYAFKEVAKRFVGTARRVDGAELQNELRHLDLNPDHITGAYDLRAEASRLSHRRNSSIQPWLHGSRRSAVSPSIWRSSPASPSN